MTGGCPHTEYEPVILMTGETVAQVCTHCLDSLPVQWGCKDCEWVEITRLGSAVPEYLPGWPCQRHAEMTRL